MSDTEYLLKILQAHGEQFLQSFSNPGVKNLLKSKGVTGEDARQRHPESNVSDDSEEEWGGIREECLAPECEEDILISDDEKDFEQDDDQFTAESSKYSKDVIVYSDKFSNDYRVDPVSKAQKKSFMSSKVSKQRNEYSVPSLKSSIEKEDEKTNAQNDALLHKLVHTKLLSGSMTTELELTPAQRRKALEGRVLELTGEVKLGSGEKVVRQAEQNKAAKHIRDGIALKQKERAKRELEEAKNMGNYHPALKSLHRAASTASTTRTRTRGLKMGVGRFSGGFLHLSRDEISSVTEGPGPIRNLGKGDRTAKRGSRRDKSRR